MKKRVLSMLIAAALVCSVIPMEAFASQTSGSMAVSYTHEFSPEYMVNIPATFSINDDEICVFSADQMNIGDDKEIHVSINGEATYENGGNFYLYKDKGTENEARIPCNIMVSNPSGSIGWTQINGASADVATFRNSNTSPLGYGAIKLVPKAPSDSPYGMYTGNIYFKIELINR